MKFCFKIIIYVLELLQKNFECFTSKPNAHGTFRNLLNKINLKINILETNEPIELKFCIGPTLNFENVDCAVLKSWQLIRQFQN